MKPSWLHCHFLSVVPVFAHGLPPPNGYLYLIKELNNNFFRRLWSRGHIGFSPSPYSLFSSLVFPLYFLWAQLYMKFKMATQTCDPPVSVLQVYYQCAPPSRPLWGDFFQVWMWGLSNPGLLGERRTRQLSQPREDIFIGGKLAGRKSQFFWLVSMCK